MPTSRLEIGATFVPATMGDLFCLYRANCRHRFVGRRVHAIGLRISRRDNWLMALTSTRSAEFRLSDLAKRRFTVVKDQENAKREDLRRFSDSEILVQKLEHVWYAGTMQSLNAFAEASHLPIPKVAAVTEGPKPLLSILLKPSPIRDGLLQWRDEVVEVQEIQRNCVEQLDSLGEEVHLEIFSGERLSIRLTIKGIEGVASDKIMEEIRALQQPNLNYLESYIKTKVKSYRLSQREQFAWRPMWLASIKNLSRPKRK